MVTKLDDAELRVTLKFDGAKEAAKRAMEDAKKEEAEQARVTGKAAASGGGAAQGKAGDAAKGNADAKKLAESARKAVSSGRSGVAKMTAQVTGAIAAAALGVAVGAPLIREFAPEVAGGLNELFAGVDKSVRNLGALFGIEDQGPGTVLAPVSPDEIVGNIDAVINRIVAILPVLEAAAGSAANTVQLVKANALLGEDVSPEFLKSFATADFKYRFFQGELRRFGELQAVQQISQTYFDIFKPYIGR